MLSGSQQENKDALRQADVFVIFLKGRGNRKYSHIVQNAEIFRQFRVMGYSMHVYSISYTVKHTVSTVKNDCPITLLSFLSIAFRLRGRLKWTETCFSRTSPLISMLALQSMSLTCVSQGKTTESSDRSRSK